ncbi:MAG: hypothetical protein K5739_04700 [Lachnospiraceae bacterium]|nr:hypothetical protein [Lachnospiraceae bacterium]
MGNIVSGVWILVFIIIMARVSTASKKVKDRRERALKEKDVNQQVGLTNDKKSLAFNPAMPIDQYGRQQTPAQKRPSQSRPAQNRPATAQRTQPASAAAKPGEENMSTTEMLAKKAQLDQVEHQKEQFEHRQHERMYYGNYNYARRYLLGDTVAATDKLVYCPNCAAENLVKIHENPAKYHCYFCREKLS